MGLSLKSIGKATGIGAAAGLAGSLFNKLFKPSSPTIDYGAMNDIVSKGVNDQTGIVNQQYSDLQPLGVQYANDMDKVSAGYKGEVSGLGEAYAKSLQNLSSLDKEAATKSLDLQTQKTMRQVPLLQTMLRQQLAATGNLRTGSAGKTLQQPVLNAQQSLSDYGQTLDINNINKNSARQEKAADTIYQGNMGAALQRLGLDKEKFTTLLNNGRTDIIAKAMGLLGISQQQVADLLGIQGVKTNVELADVGAKNARQQAILDALFSLGGKAIAASGGK